METLNNICMIAFGVVMLLFALVMFWPERVPEETLIPYTDADWKRSSASLPEPYELEGRPTTPTEPGHVDILAWMGQMRWMAEHEEEVNNDAD